MYSALTLHFRALQYTIKDIIGSELSLSDSTLNPVTGWLPNRLRISLSLSSEP